MASQVDRKGFRKQYAASLALQSPGMSQCQGTKVSVTLNHPVRILRQLRYSVAILKLFARELYATETLLQPNYQKQTSLSRLVSSVSAY